ncbi:MAG: type II toxin-antitoxin system YoeB family toxin [Syntrophobacteraceae bacterium]|nr:type II toxin-antitoxin system YoeB family toxin [Syntrophobacteraceae bacterium]
MKRVIFEADAFEDFNGWAVQDKKLYAKIVDLIRDIAGSPFTGPGKPEPLLRGAFRPLRPGAGL